MRFNLNNAVQWRKTARETPHYDSDPNALGTQVLIWPHYESLGAAPSPIAFYGVRASDKPNFYLYGAVLYPAPTHWEYLPTGPKLKPRKATYE